MARRATFVDDASAVAPRHGRQRRRHPYRSIIKYVSIGLATVLVATVGVAGISFLQLTTSIDTVDLGGVDSTEAPPGFSNYSGAFNVLLVGSDTREGQGAGLGEGSYNGGALNDVTMLLHVSADHQRATVVSFPRDLIVNFPSCPATEQGGSAKPAARGVQFNTALGRGGLPCVAAVVESMTGLDVPFAATITFTGVINMSTAVGGVPVCFAGPVRDRWTGLEIPEAGTYELQGEQALQFLRSRHGVGDGSDLSRISSQQVFLSSLVRTMQSDAVLTDLGRLYQIAQVATQNMTLSTGLNDIGTMVSMARVLADIPLDTMQFVAYPTLPSGQRVVPDTASAAALMELIRSDQPITLDPNAVGQASVTETPAPSTAPGASSAPSASGGPSASAAPSATAAPSAPAAPSATAAPEATTPATPAPSLGNVTGQNAAQETCVVPFGQ